MNISNVAAEAGKHLCLDTADLLLDPVLEYLGPPAFTYSHQEDHLIRPSEGGTINHTQSTLHNDSASTAGKLARVGTSVKESTTPSGSPSSSHTFELPGRLHLHRRAYSIPTPMT